MGGFYVADKQTCEEFDMTMSKKQFYDLAGVPIRRIFEILAEEQGKTPDLDAMAARCKVRTCARPTNPGLASKSPSFRPVAPSRGVETVLTRNINIPSPSVPLAGARGRDHEPGTGADPSCGGHRERRESEGPPHRGGFLRSEAHGDGPP